MWFSWLIVDSLFYKYKKNRKEVLFYFYRLFLYFSYVYFCHDPNFDQVVLRRRVRQSPRFGQHSGPFVNSVILPSPPLLPIPSVTFPLVSGPIPLRLGSVNTSRTFRVSSTFPFRAWSSLRNAELHLHADFFHISICGNFPFLVYLSCFTLLVYSSFVYIMYLTENIILTPPSCFTPENLSPQQSSNYSFLWNQDTEDLRWHST